jgi:hypothetical protein
MNKLSEKKLDKEFFLSFRKWVNFNMESLTWQGRYRKEFEEFWVAFFSDGMLISDTILRFDYSCKAVKVGPLFYWFTWLR